MTQDHVDATVIPTKGMAFKNPELAHINGHFSGEHGPKRFNGFGQSNDGSHSYYDPTINPESALTRACVSVEWSAFSEITQDAKMIYIPCGISSGLRAHELLDQKNQSRRAGAEKAVSTYKAEEHLGAGTHLKSAMLPNRDDNLRRGRIVGRTHPDAMIIAPVVREGAVRALKDYSFARGQRYEEEDFMAFWYPTIDRCKGMMLDITSSGLLDFDQTVNDWNFSRNSIWEMMRGVLIQAGEVPARPKADMDVFDIENRPVTLLARAWKMSEMLQYQLGKGFETREAATALAQIFTLDDEMRSGKIPAKGASLHPILRDRPEKELKAMDELKAQFKPLLLAHCAHTMRLNDLPDDYQNAAKQKPQPLTAEQKKHFADFANSISTRAGDILSVKPSRELMAKLAKTDPAPQRMFDSHERFFEKRAHSLMFEDDIYSKLSEWERLALPFAIGATETGLYPTAHPMATMILTDLKRGKEGFARAQKIGAQDMNEFAGAADRDTATVIAANTQAAEALKAQLKKQTPRKIVVNTPSFLRIADTIEHFRKIGEPKTGPNRFIKAPGATETSPQLRLALQMKFLERNADCAVFQEGWEHSNDLVQLRVRARLIQAGMIERPAGAQSSLRVLSAGDLKTPETLLDDIKALTAEVKRTTDAGVVAPEQALALARLVTLHELLVDPSLADTDHKTSRQLINTLTADESLTCYNRKEAKTVTEEAKTLLKEKALFVKKPTTLTGQVSARGNDDDPRLIARERLYAPVDASDSPERAAAKEVQNKRMEDYIKAQDHLHGEEGLVKQPTRRNATRITSSGVLQ